MTTPNSPSTTASPARYGALITFLVWTFLAGAIGTFATLRTVHTWYPTLAKPAWTPPGVWFGPVWTLLYIMMAIAVWRIWRAQPGGTIRPVLRSYAAQLCLNALWSVLFFAFQRPDLALIDIVALWVVLVIMLVRFGQADRTAGLLWAPYVGWVTFAAALNAAVWAMNR